MMPTAYVCHRMNGRIRLRVPSRRGDPEFFARCLEEIEKEFGCKVQINSFSGSVLVVSKEGEEALLARVVALGLFELVEKPPAERASDPVAAQMRRGLSQLDEHLKEASSGRLDFVSVATLGLLGLGAIQALRGASVGPASSLFLHALSLVNKGTVET
jgi:hypothetical protein